MFKNELYDPYFKCFSPAASTSSSTQMEEHHQEEIGFEQILLAADNKSLFLEVLLDLLSNPGTLRTDLF